MNFNTGFYHSGSIIKKRKYIFKYYLKYMFWIDIINIISIIDYANLNDILLYALCFLRIV